MTPARVCVADPYQAYRESIVELPDRFTDQGVTLHAARNVIKTLAISSPGRDPLDVAVKAFAVPARPRGFVYAHLRRSKALRSMLNAGRLLELGVGTPSPVACIEYHDSGCLTHSYYVCRYWTHDYDLAALLYRDVSQGADPESLLEQLVRFTAEQHDGGVQHRDYNPGNILVRSHGARFEFSLVDLNRLRFQRLDQNDRIRGLVRLTTNRSYLRIIGRVYAALLGADPEDFCRRLDKEHTRFLAGRRRLKRSLALLRQLMPKTRPAPSD